MSALLHGTMPTDEAASYLGVHVQTLKRWRGSDYGPKYLRIGKLIRYKEVDLDAWVEELSARPEA